MTSEPLKARVSNGRLILDEPTDLPEGTEVELVVLGEGDDMDESERAALHHALDRSLHSLDDGNTRPASDLINELRARHR